MEVPTCGDEMRKRHLQTTHLSKAKQPAAVSDYAALWSVQNSTVLSRPGGTYYDLLARVALWNLSRWGRYMEVTLDQDAKGTRDVRN